MAAEADPTDIAATVRDLIARVGECMSTKDAAAGATGVAALEELVRHVEEDRDECARAAFLACICQPSGPLILRKMKLDKILRRAVPDWARGVELLGRLLPLLRATPRWRDSDEYIWHASLERAQAARLVFNEMKATFEADHPAADAAAAEPTGGVAEALGGKAPAAQPPSAPPVAVEPQGDVQAPPPAPAAGLTFPLILWVDDRPQNNVIEVGAAQAAGARVVQFRTTQEAVAFLEQHDRRLGEMDGSQFRIVSDRSRTEQVGGAEDPDAVFALWDAVRLEAYLRDTPMLIYTSAFGVSQVQDNLVPRMRERGVPDPLLRVTCDRRACISFVTFGARLPGECLF